MAIKKIYVQKPSFESLRKKKQQEKSTRKRYRKSYGRSTITQRPMMASTPPKLHTIYENGSSSHSSSSKKSSKTRSPINVSRRDSPTQLLRQIKKHSPKQQKNKTRKTNILQSIQNTASSVMKMFSKTSKLR